MAEQTYRVAVTGEGVHNLLPQVFRAESEADALEQTKDFASLNKGERLEIVDDPDSKEDQDES